MPLARSRHTTRDAVFLDIEDTIPATSVSKNVTTSTVPSAVRDENESEGSSIKTGFSTSVLIQLLFLILFIVAIAAYVLHRRASHKRALRNKRHVRHISQISAPNGLGPGPGGNIPPTYQEALKSPAITVSTFPVSSHQRQRSDEALMEQCWAAVYDAEEGNHRDGPRSPAYSTTPSPQSTDQSPQRNSVSQWLRGQRWLTSSGSKSGPLSSNPPRTPTTAGLPTPPSPSYNGVPPTPTASAPQTPMSSTYLVAPLRTSNEPLSARSWATGEERLSIRASIPNSVLYPSPLQPAPPGRRLSEMRRNRESTNSALEYGSETWRTMTPHEDPPEYEPRRGDPTTVSPV